MKRHGPKREEFDTFEEWVIARSHWRVLVSKTDRLFPFVTKLCTWGMANPIPIKRERGGRDR